MKSNTGIVLIVLGFAAVAGLLYLSFAPVEVEVGVRKGANVRGKGSSSGILTFRDRSEKLTKVDSVKRVGGKAAKKSTSRQVTRPPEDWYAKLPAADRVIGKRIQDAQDAGNREAVFSAAEDALKSKNVEVRQAAVDAISLQDGEDTIPYLEKFLSDSDDGVASSAYWAWDNAVDGENFEHARSVKIKAALPQIKDDEQLQLAVDKFTMMERALAIRELADLVKANHNKGRVSDAAKKAYESVVGEPFTDWASAQLKAISAEREAAE